MLYKEWLGEWLEHYVEPSVKPKTYQRYAEIVHNHLNPKLGDYDVDELTPLIVQRYITELTQSGNLRTGKGLSANSINSIIAVIQGSLESAHTLNISKEYEMKKLKRPKAREKQIECFSIEEQKRIEEAVLEDKRDKMVGVLICLFTGLRLGEILALEWTNIDFNKAELIVNKTCHDCIKNGEKYRVTNTPKTTTSMRVIPLPKQLLPVLCAVKKRSKSPFVVADGENYVLYRSYQRSFDLLQEKLKIPHRGFHALRHTFATRALECGVDVKTLSEILGHKNPSVTLSRYVHSMMEHKRDMMNRIGNLL